MITALIAAGVSIQLHGISLHSHHEYTRDGVTKEFNGVNLGAGLRYQFNPDWAVQAGAYKNSYYRSSTYAVAEYSPVEVGGLRLGAFLGTVNGYYLHDGGFVPGGGLSVRKDWERANTILRFIPPTEKTAGVAALEIGVKF